MLRVQHHAKSCDGHQASGWHTHHEMPYLTIRDLTEAAEGAIAIGRKYAVRRRGELFYDAILFAVLHERHGPIVRQWKLPLLCNQARAKRIDFKERRQRGAVVEFAVRARTGAELSASQNRSELRKLLRAKSARIRILLLLDPSARPALTSSALRQQYRRLNLGRGRFNRLAVRVVYVRPGFSFHFTWRP